MIDMPMMEYWKRPKCPRCRGYLKPYHDREEKVWFKCRHCDFESKKYASHGNIKGVSQADLDAEWMRKRERVAKRKKSAK
jgi:hypothetical protein